MGMNLITAGKLYERNSLDTRIRRVLHVNVNLGFFLNSICLLDIH